MKKRTGKREDVGWNLFPSMYLKLIRSINDCCMCHLEGRLDLINLVSLTIKPVPMQRHLSHSCAGRFCILDNYFALCVSVYIELAATIYKDTDGIKRKRCQKWKEKLKVE